jgi:hypothetical protein
MENLMSTFDNRENAFENKFALDEEQQFKAVARRDKLTGLWAASLLGHTGDAATAYAKSIVIADMEEAGDEDVIRKLVKDLEGKASRAEIIAKLHELAGIAAKQIHDGV